MSISPAKRCAFCGYDLRGIASRVCPECGQARSITLRIADPKAFHIARAALEHAGILRSCIDPIGSFDYEYAAMSSTGYLRVSEADLERAEGLLDHHGVAWVEEMTSLIDPRDPTCPQCQRTIPIVGGRECPHCKHGVYWLEAGDEISPDDNVVCPDCLDQVTLTGGRCPKCGATVVDTPPDQQR